MLAGDLIAGGTTSRPANPDKTLLEFGTGLITTRAPFVAPTAAGNAIKQAVDAAVVRVIDSGKFRDIETKYYESNGFETVAAFTCVISPDQFPFPEEPFANNEMRVGSLGPANWGYQGEHLMSYLFVLNFPPTPT